MSCDPNFVNVVFLVNCDGVDSSDVFTDLSPEAHTITASSGAAVSTSDPKFGTGALAKTGSFENINTPVDSSLDLPSGGDFTVEFWMRIDETTGVLGIMECGATATTEGFRIHVSADPTTPAITCQFVIAGGWGSIDPGAGSYPADNGWHHIAVVRSGNQGYLYVDGIAVNTGTDNTWTGSPAIAGLLRFGRQGASGQSALWNGAIDEIRITRGVARYAANFTPPTEAFGTEQCEDPAIVPDVTGETLEDATTDIELALLVVGVVTSEHSETVPAGSIVDQDPAGGTELIVGQSVNLVLSTGPVVCSGVPFEGYIAWPYLDFGLLGVDKMMEGFDIVADGTFRVAIGYSQRDFSLATPEYALDGDTLVGGMVPMPLTAPSYQFRITFDSEQSWQWFATNLYLSNTGIG